MRVTTRCDSNFIQFSTRVYGRLNSVHYAYAVLP
jgi:hypothetical protein